MTQVMIWHNPRCSKSRATMALLREHGIEPEVVRYLEDTPSAKAIERVLETLGVPPRLLMRTKETKYRQMGLAEEQSDEALIAAMVANPVLIERPIVICGKRAAIGRPPENALKALP
ncbi:MAG: arsenate reductase (glutaredoxin) [Planctomycetota bacterium]